MLIRFGALIIVVVSILAVISVLQSEVELPQKLGWVTLIVLLPVVGPVLWFVLRT